MTAVMAIRCCRIYADNPVPGTHVGAGYMGIILSMVGYAMHRGAAEALAKFDSVLDALPTEETFVSRPEQIVAFYVALLEQGFRVSKFSESFEVDWEKQDQFQLGDIGYLCGTVGDPYFVTLCNIHDQLGPVTDAGKHYQADRIVSRAENELADT
jgi:hypothetical protein